MERIEVYLNNKNELIIDAYFETKNENPDYRLLGKKAENFIFNLPKTSIRSIKEQSDNLIINYNGLKLVINEYMDVLSIKHYNNLFNPILLQIKKYEEKQKLNKLNKRKVTRKNKHIKTRMLAGGLALLVLSGVIVGRKKKTDKMEKNSITTTFYTQIADEYNELKNHVLSLTTNNNEKTIINLSEQKNSNNSTIESVHLSYDDRTQSTKAQSTDSNYRTIIEKYSKTYGLDSNLMLAIATQESGDHYSNVESGPAVGLMQIEKSVWENGGTLNAYNFDTQSWENINVDVEELKNLDYNVKIGCMMFQESLRNSNYNILAAIQNYNMGYGNMYYNIIPAYCSDTNKTIEEVLNNQYDTGWLGYRNLVDVGDSNYLEHVLSYYGDKCNISVTKPDGTKASVNVDNNKLNKVY